MSNNTEVLIADEDHRFAYQLGPQGSNKFWFRVDAAGPEKVTPQEAVEITARLVKAYNLFPELVEVLEGLVGAISYEDELGRTDEYDKAKEILKKAKE